MDRVEKFIISELDHHIALQDTVYGERRRANKAALKTGRVIVLQLLTPSGPEPFRRGRERLGQAIAAFTARGKPDKRV